MKTPIRFPGSRGLADSGWSMMDALIALAIFAILSVVILALVLNIVQSAAAYVLDARQLIGKENLFAEEFSVFFQK